MIVSLNYLKNLVGVDTANPDELCGLIGSRLVEIEEVTKLADKYDRAIVVRVVECVDHPDSDHLHVCKIDDANSVDDVERDVDGLVQVVCGAPNVHAEMLAVWLPPQTIVPETFGTSEEFKLSSRKLRGVMSHGMLASDRELDLGGSHDGILEVAEGEATVGDNLGELLDLRNDLLLEVENKSLTHRPDCFGMIGFGREVAAIGGNDPKVPKWFDLDFAEKQLAKLKGSEINPTINIDDAICSRYTCVALDYDGGGKTDLYTKSLLTRLGVNSVSYIVDATNMVMLETGQPLHAYDLDKLIAVSPTGKPDLFVRLAKEGEELDLIDGRHIKLSAEDIVIAVGDNDNSLPVALAGAMGGASTEIDSSTKRILLESATFDLYHLRATQFRHGIFSDAITRFTKGLPPKLTGVALARIIDLLATDEHTRALSPVIDYVAPDNWQPDPNSRLEKFVKKHEGRHSFAKIMTIEIGRGTSSIDFDTSLVTKILGKFDGEKLTLAQIRRVLKNLGYEDIDVDSDDVDVDKPWWRMDLHIPEDVIEDIGRVLGYDNIDKKLPSRKYTATPVSRDFRIERTLCDRMMRVGANEVMTYSFVHGDLLRKVGDDANGAYRIVNALSPDLQYYRRDLLPSLVNIAAPNLKAGYDDFCLFEIGKVHRKGQMDVNEPELPAEIRQLSAIIVDSRAVDSYYRAKHVLDYLLQDNINGYRFIRIDQCDQELDSTTNIYEPKRAARIEINDGELIGYIGELKSAVCKSFKLPESVAGFTIYLDNITSQFTDRREYTPVLRYQGTSRDLTVAVDSKKTFAEVMSYIDHQLVEYQSGLVINTEPLDIYKPTDGKINMTFRIEFSDRDKTIDVQTVGELMKKLSADLERDLDAKIV